MSRVQAEQAVSDLERLARLLRSSEQIEGLYPVQWEALRYLQRANRFSRSPGALADFLGATRGTVSQSLIALERKGLIARKPDPRDRRVRRLFLSEAGRRLLDRDPLLGLASLAAGLPKKRRRGLAKQMYGSG